METSGSNPFDLCKDWEINGLSISDGYTYVDNPIIFCVHESKARLDIGSGGMTENSRQFKDHDSSGES